MRIFSDGYIYNLPNKLKIANEHRKITNLKIEKVFQLLSLSKDPFKRIKHVGQTLLNIVGHNMFDPFEQHNQTCWIVLDDVG